MIEIPEVRVHLLEWQATLHSYVWKHIQAWGDGCKHYLLTQHSVNLWVSAEKHQQTNKCIRLKQQDIPGGHSEEWTTVTWQTCQGRCQALCRRRDERHQSWRSCHTALPSAWRNTLRFLLMCTTVKKSKAITHVLLLEMHMIKVILRHIIIIAIILYHFMHLAGRLKPPQTSSHNHKILPDKNHMMPFTISLVLKRMPVFACSESTQHTIFHLCQTLKALPVFQWEFTLTLYTVLHPYQPVQCVCECECVCVCVCVCVHLSRSYAWTFADVYIMC